MSDDPSIFACASRASSGGGILELPHQQWLRVGSSQEVTIREGVGDHQGILASDWQVPQIAKSLAAAWAIFQRVCLHDTFNLPEAAAWNKYNYNVISCQVLSPHPSAHSLQLQSYILLSPS